MVTLWIGDFRARQLQNTFKAAQQTAEYHYLGEDLAEYSWFKDSVVSQLPLLSLENANIIIMLGFHDCVYSCVWDHFKIDTIAVQYKNTINELIVDYPNYKFYVCSVGPVEADYPFIEYGAGVIPQKQLTDKIKLFNKTLKDGCKAEYIDSFNYLTATGFATRDGVRYLPDTCSALHNYISSKVSQTLSGTFLPRITAPDPNVDSSLYWTNVAFGGESPFALKNAENGSTLPDSAAYTWGRFYEITGEVPKLSKEDANKWYSYNDGYQRGLEPRVGAIACWTSSVGGYVAVVEQVKEDGSIIISESDWDTVDTTDTWRLTERTKGTGNWELAGYTFQGFIYGPQTVGISKDAVLSENRHLTIEEMKPNAQYIYQYLSSKGWTLNAVAGLLGNVQVESKMSPAVWQSLVNGTGTLQADGTRTVNTTVLGGSTPGFGLVQWTPYYKFTDWCASRKMDYLDIDNQLFRINYEVESGDQWISRPSKGYDLSFREFISSTRDASWLAEAFAFCYERPGSSTGTTEQQNALRAERSANGDFWYSYLSTLSLDITTSKGPKISGFKIDKCEATQASVSFLIQSGSTVSYKLSKANKIIESKSITTKADYHVLNLKNLVPASEYTLELVTENADGEKISRELSFATLQDYPSSVKNIELTATKKDVNGLFTLKITKPEYLGYWKNKSGYDIQLIVNNANIKTITENNATKDFILKDFNIEKKFGHKCTTGDTIQIGIRVWVNDDKGNKLYDSSQSKTSEAICLLSNPTQLTK